MPKIMIAALLTLFLTSACQTQDESQHKSLYEAVRKKQAAQVARILDTEGVELNPPPQPYHNQPLGHAAGYGNLEIVKLLLARGADINGRGAYSEVPLIKAAEHGNMDILLYLIEKGADVNHPNSFGISPFIGFCGGAADFAAIKLALAHGGKINESYPVMASRTPGTKNYTALQSAVDTGSPETVQLLLDHGGDPWLKHGTGKNCFDIAREKNRPAILEILQARKH